MSKISIQVFFVGDDPTMMAVKQVTTTLANIEVSQNAQDAHIVVTMGYSDLEPHYNKEQEFIYLVCGHNDCKGASLPKNHADNIHAINVFSATVDILRIISSVAQKLKAATAKTEQKIQQPVVVEVVPEQVDYPLSILVVDDSPKHQDAAKRFLAGHNVTVVNGYEAAMKALQEYGTFDVVITDVNMPMSSNTLSNSAFQLGVEVPNGLLLIFEAARQGADFIAAATDANHHQDWVSAAFDHFQGHAFRLQQAWVALMHAPLTHEGAKAYDVILDNVLDLKPR